MIKAEHNKIARVIFNPYIERQLRKSFSNFYIVNEAPSLDKNVSILITPNHISWWDGFFIDKINRQYFQKKIHLMMLEKQLRRYWYFRFLGAFSIDPGDPHSIPTTIRYIKGLTSDPHNSIVIYPQGEIEAFEKKPLTIREGLKVFTYEKSNEVKILPIAFKIQYYNKKNPAVIARFGNPIDVEKVQSDFEYYKEAFTSNLDMLAEAAYSRSFQSDLFVKS